MRANAKRRRPRGISRKEKHRRLKFESLEDRRVMSANPITQAADDVMVLTREQTLDDEVIQAFERSSNLAQYTPDSLEAADGWVVLMSVGGDVHELDATSGVEIVTPTNIIPDTYIVTPGEDGVEGLIEELSSSQDVDYFYPLINRKVSPLSLPNDPYLQYQWHLINIGQNTGSPDFAPYFGTPGEDINVSGAWDAGYTGNGVTIGIVDEGVDITHPDLIGNVSTEIPGIDVGGGFSDAHGTAVAGLAAGSGNNGLGTTGVAYESEIVPIDAIPFGNDFDISIALTYQFQDIDIYNHSWGFLTPIDNPRLITDFGPLSTSALRNSVFFGRGGLGSIHVFSSGNEGFVEVDGGGTTSQYSGATNSRYTIAVTGVDENGKSVGYAEGGANVLVSAPTGSTPFGIIRDDNLGSGIWTLDLEGEAGNNNSTQTPVDGNGNFFVDGYIDYFDTLFYPGVGEDAIDYQSRFTGTSASAPIVSGVIALMLEANPNLSYRDVQHILVASARHNDPTDAGWITNLREQQYDPIPPSAPFGSYSLGGSFFPFASRYIIDRHQSHYTNGAGFTVNQGAGSAADPGMGHGVVDASLAVELARNWKSVGPQTSEFTWSTGSLLSGKVTGAVISDELTFNTLIPGGIVGDNVNQTTFEEYYNEFGIDPTGDPPFEDKDGPLLDPPVNDRDFGGAFYFSDETRAIPVQGGQPGLTINGIPPMSVEWIEVELNLGVNDPNVLDFLRVTLVSPDGTHSELNAFGTPVGRPTDHFDGLTSFGDPAGNLGTTSMVFTTNRHWGERTEDRYRVGDFIDLIDYNQNGVTVNEILSRVATDNYSIPLVTDPFHYAPIYDTWRLTFENYSDEDIDIQSYEVAFHGVDVAGTGRIQGAVGVDDNGDGVFSDLSGTKDNFNRYDVTDVPFDTDGVATRFLLSEAEQESWAAGVIVYADLNNNGQRDISDAFYQVGADGNYFFDLPANATYNLHIDPDSLASAGLETVANLNLANAGPFATVTIDAVGQRVLGKDFLDNTEVMSPTSPAFSYGVAESIKSETDLNFLFDPAPVAPETIDISGVVFADLDSNGIQDGVDFALANANVYIDINQNGIYTPGVDYVTATDASGHYSFESGLNGVPSTTPTGFYIIGVIPGSTNPYADPVNPITGEYERFFDFTLPEVFGDAGFIIEDLNFAFAPGAGSGEGPNVGSIAGVVYDDANGNGIQDGGEVGLQNAANVYLDLNPDNMRGTYFDEFGEELFEPVVTPAGNGAYSFVGLEPGSYDVRIEFSETQYDQTTPSGPLNPDGSRVDEDDWEYVIEVLENVAIDGQDFGLKNLAVLDYGDLPDVYGTTSASGGATHVVFGDLYLGDTPTDAEVDAPIQLDGTGDNVTGFDDEDGITFSTLFNGSAPSTSVTITVDANVEGGYLQGWMDFNEDGIFQVSERVFDDQLLPIGESVFVVPVPANLTGGGGTVYSRFRYGEQGIDSPVGPAIKGEVEDYGLRGCQQYYQSRTTDGKWS